MVKFNVLTQPWITAVDRGGNEQQYGILDLLKDAHDVQAVVDASPLIQFGLYRILIAFVQDALQLREFEDVADAFDAGAFDSDVFETYVAGIGTDRFDLFDSKHPFLQTPRVEGDDKRPHSVVRLFYHFPAGSNVIHFAHVQAEEHAVAPAVAARALCSIAPFMTSGGAGYSPSVNGTPPWYLLALGENLFQTLLLNCCTMDIGGLNWDAPPVWAATDTFEPRAEKRARSLAEGFTWQPRQVRLLPGDGGTCTYSGEVKSTLIRQMVWGPGHKFGGHEIWLDPHVAYTLDETRGNLPLRPRAERQLWRDYGPLFLRNDRTRGKDKFSRPAIVSQIKELKSSGLIPDDIAEQFEIYGMRVDKAKVFEWQYERMPLRTEVLENPTADVQVTHALDLAESVSRGLYGAIKIQYPRDSKTNRTALNNIIRGSQSTYWAELGERFQTTYLPALALQNPKDERARAELLEEWKLQLRNTGRRCFEEASSGIETGAKALERQVKARNFFRAMLWKTLGDVLTHDQGRVS